MSDKHDHDDIAEIDCLEAIDNLYAYLDGELNDTESLNRFHKHLDHCKSCYSRSELEGVLTDRIKVTGKNKTPEALKTRLRNLIDDL